MANVCKNEIFITTEDISNYSYLLEKLEHDLVGDIHYTTEETIEGTFKSKWTFPSIIFKAIVEKLPNREDKSLYLRVFSYEHGNYYHKYNVYSTKRGWEIF